MRQIPRILQMIAMRKAGLSEFVNNSILLSFLLPFDFFLYIIRPWYRTHNFRLKNHDGLFLRLGTTDPYVFSQMFIEKEYDSHVLDSISPSVVIDLGAYSGYSTFYFRNRFPQATIIAIEANYSNYKVLEASFASDKQVKVIHAAIHNSDGLTLKIEVGKDGLWGSRAVNASVDDFAHGDLAVKTISLETVLNRFGLWNKSDMLLKIDIEGGELEVFDTSINIWDFFDVIAIETHDRIRPGCTLTFSEVSKHYRDTDFRGDVTFVSSPKR